MPHLVSSRQFRGAAIAVAIIAVALLAVNILLIGGDAFVISFNSILNPPLAIIITVMAAIIWHRMQAERRRRLLWTGMLIGWALWALAETIWAIYTISGQEIPYPSMADFFWLLGYVPMGIGLITRTLTMPAKPSRSQNMAILGASVTGPAFVEARITEVGSRFSDAAHADAALYGRPDSAVRFADGM